MNYFQPTMHFVLSQNIFRKKYLHREKMKTEKHLKKESLLYSYGIQAAVSQCLGVGVL